jgi:hypothetical protein
MRSGSAVEEARGVPFTPSHIAAALPFVRTPLPIAPLVIGTMAPDVPYYLPLRVPRDLTHSLVGVPTIDLAITIVLVLLWYAVVRAPVVDLLPRAIRDRVEPRPVVPRGRRVAAIALGVLAALVGILTHLVWDAFTHENSSVVQAVPVLHAQLGPLEGSSWLQHISTVAGLAVLAGWVVMWMRRTTPDAARPTLSTVRSRVVAWIAVALAFAGTGLVIWTGFIAQGLPPFDPSPVFLSVAIAGGAAGLAGAIVCAVWWIVRATRRT